METKTRRFGTISDLYTPSTSCRRCFEIKFSCGDSPTLLPFKPLILTPPAKIVDNCLPLGFYQQFFCVRVPNIISNMKNKKLPAGTRCWSSYTMPEQTPWRHRAKNPSRYVFMLSSDQYKKRCRHGAVLQAMCVLPDPEKFPSSSRELVAL